MDLGIYIVQARCRHQCHARFSHRSRGAETTTGFFNETEGNNQVHLKLPTARHLDATTSFNGNGNYFKAEGSKGWFEMTKGAFRGTAGARD